MEEAFEIADDWLGEGEIGLSFQEPDERFSVRIKRHESIGRIRTFCCHNGASVEVNVGRKAANEVDGRWEVERLSHELRTEEELLDFIRCLTLAGAVCKLLNERVAARERGPGRGLPEEVKPLREVDYDDV